MKQLITKTRAVVMLLSLLAFLGTTTVNAQCPPPPPTAIATQVYTGSGTIANLAATGSTIQWYSAATAGTVLPATTSLVDGAIYYATQTVSGCESTRLAVRVKKISEATQTFCAPATVANLVSTPSAG